MPLTTEQSKILNMADKTGIIRVSDKLVCAGVHFCPEWDQLPICADSHEWDACLCNIKLRHEEPE